MRPPRDTFDADVLLCFASAGDIPLAIETAEALRAAGETVRVDQEPPRGLKFRRVLRAEKGGVTEC